jgi:hypothetical protein
MISDLAATMAFWTPALACMKARTPRRLRATKTAPQRIRKRVFSLDARGLMISLVS